MNNPEAFFLSYLMMFSLSVLLLLHCKHSPLRPHLYSVFEILRSEARVMEGLRSLLIDTPFIHDILKLNVQPSDSDYAVDIRNSAINVRNQVIIPHFSSGQTVRVKVFFFFVTFSTLSGSTTWRLTTGTAPGPPTFRSCSDQPSLESSDRYAKTFTTW